MKHKKINNKAASICREVIHPGSKDCNLSKIFS